MLDIFLSIIQKQFWIILRNHYFCFFLIVTKWFFIRRRFIIIQEKNCLIKKFSIFEDKYFNIKFGDNDNYTS